MKLCGLPPFGNQVAHTCTGMACTDPLHPSRPGLVGKERKHPAPLPFANPRRKNQTSYLRFIDNLENAWFNVPTGFKLRCEPLSHKPVHSPVMAVTAESHGAEDILQHRFS